MILLNYESDCSILDSSIPPKGISQKQWEKNRQETVKSIKKSNNPDLKPKSLSKGKNGQSELQVSSENIYSSSDLVSNSFSLHSVDENIKTPKRFKPQYKEATINREDREQKASKNKKSTQNQNENKKIERSNSSKYQNKHDNDKKSTNSNFQESSSNISTTIEEYQKDLWFQKSIKSISSIKKSPRKQNNLISSVESSDSLSKSFSFQLNENQNPKEIKDESNEVSNNEKSSSEEKVAIDINLDNEINSEDNNGSEIINVSCNRSGKINIFDIPNSNYNTNTSNNDIYHDDNVNNNSNDKGNDNYNDIINKENRNKDNPNNSNYKDKIKWEFKNFDNIFDIESPKDLNNRKRAVKKAKKSKLHPNTSSNLQTKQNTVKKQRKSKQKAITAPDPQDRSQSLINENQIDSEHGQLELPSSSAYEFCPKLGPSEVEVEVNFFDNNELVNSPQPSYISHVNRSPSKSSHSIPASPKEEDLEIVNKNAKNYLHKTSNLNRKGKNYPFDEDSSTEAQNDFIVQLRKSAQVLSSSTESDDEKSHKDKSVSMNGIVLYMLSSSGTEAAAANGVVENESENNGQTFTVSALDNQLSSSSKTSQNISHEFENTKNSQNSQNSEPAIDFENAKLNENEIVNHITNSNVNENQRKRRIRRKNLVASLTVVQAHGLPALNVPRRDPYCLVNFKGSHEPFKTKVMRDTSSPIWNSKFNIDVKKADIPLVFTVRYEDKFGGDIDVAVGEISLKNAEKGKYYESWIRLHPVNFGGFSMDDQNALNSISTACELYITFVIDTKKSVIQSTERGSKISSPKNPQKVENSLNDGSSQKVRASSSSSSQKVSPRMSPELSPRCKYDGEIIMTLTVVQAKNVALPHNSSSGKCSLYCAVNIIGRRDVRKTKTIYGTFSPIWDKQFKFILANRHDLVAFNIRAEDRTHGDLPVAYAEISVDEIPLNSFADRRIVLHPIKKAKRLPIRSENLLDDQAETEANENVDIEIDPRLSVGKLHFNLVLEPRLKDIPVSPRASPSTIVDDAFAEFGYPESPMTHYINRQSDNDES